MSCYYIYINDGHKMASPVTSEAQYRHLRSGTAQIENLRKARNGDQKAKQALVQFNYSGHYPNHAVKGNKLPSAAFGFDIDDPQSFEEVSQKLLASPEEYGLLMLERSVNQGGHAVFRREKGKTILENQVRISILLKCEMDTSAHDINRVYFSTTDLPMDLLYLSPELFSDSYDEASVAEEAQLLATRIEELPEDAHKANKHYRPWESQSQIAEQPQNLTPAESQNLAPSESQNLNYQGIPYSLIIAKWWEFYNKGKEPETSNRDVLTFEIAVNLRHICGYDRNLLDAVIPNYDGFEQAQKMKCIDSALSERRTQMPARLKNVLQALRKDYIDDSSIQEALDEANLEDELFYFNRIPKGALPQGVSDSVKAVGESKVMPVITAITPIIGMLATKVKVMIHGAPTHLNLISYICGKAGSGKGSIDPVVERWMAEVQAQDDVYIQQEQEFRERKKKAKNAKEQPVEPKLPVRFLALNNTLPNIAERLSNTDGIHSFSFTPEADTITSRWKSSLGDYSVMLRQAYDGSRYEREAKSAEAVNVHIKKLLWNVTMCGTQDALYRLISNYTDGLLSRICIARLPDNTFTPLAEKPTLLTPEYEDRIRQIAHLLPFMEGTLELPKLEAKSREWVEKIRLQAMLNDDTVMADARLRDHISAQRMTTCLILCMVAERLIKSHGYNGAEQMLKTNPGLTKEWALRCQTPQILETYEVIADSILENDMYFFREKMEIAYNKAILNGAGDRRIKNGKNDSIFTRLSQTFTFDEAYKEASLSKGDTVSHNVVRMMLRNWKKQGLIIQDGNNNFTKTK